MLTTPSTAISLLHGVRRRVGSCLLAVLAFAASGAVQAQQTLSFNQTPTLVSGTALTQGAVYRFPTVQTGVDAILTLQTFSNATLTALDTNTTFPERFQPTITCLATTNQTCFVRFNFQLVQAGTNTARPISGLAMSAQDVDGNSGANSIREFAEFIGATSVTLAAPTLLVTAPALAGGTRFIQSDSANSQAGVGTDNRYEIYARYPADSSAFSILGGNTIGATDCGGAGCQRLNSYTFSPTDSNLPSLTVSKVSNAGVGTFAFTGTNGYGAHTITTVTAGTAVASGTQALGAAATATTITETAPPAGFTLVSIACTGLGTGGTATPTINGTAGGSVALNAAATVATANIACTFTNRRLLSDLTITKTNTPANGVSDQAADTVVSGATTTYQLIVTNAGTDAATGATISDTPGAGITCPAANPVTCTSTATPSACPTGALTVGGLQTGLTLGTLPATAGTNTATFTFSCTVQ